MTPENAHIFEDVLLLHNRGLSVFPVSVKSKTPLVSWDRYQDETSTEEQIRKDFEYVQNREGTFAVGIACGPASDTLLLDFDFTKHPESKVWYEEHHFPRTWAEKTGSGGLHLYFRWTDELNEKQTNTTSRISLGVDTKGYGGYSKITPSPGYEWIVAPHMTPMAAVPQWLIDALPSREKKRVIQGTIIKPQDWMLTELDNIDPADPVNGRTPTFGRAIGRLKAKGLSEREVSSFLNQWAKKYDYLERLDNLIGDQFRRYPPRAEAALSPLLDHSLKSFMADFKKIPFIVPGMIGENTINLIAGLQESRKSWILLDLAVAIASGTPWMSSLPCGRRKVLILDQERAKEEMQRRILALVHGRGLNMDSLEGNLIPKAGLNSPFKLNIDSSFQEFEKLIEATKPNIILIDSLKAAQTGEINSHTDMQKLFERLKALRLKHSVSFVLLHHENKGAYEGIREKRVPTAENIEGAGVINQVPDGIFVARNNGGDSTFMHHVKNSYGMKKPPFLLKVTDVTPDKSQIRVEGY